MMWRGAISVACTVAATVTVSAQEIQYEIRFENADHHEAEVRVLFENVPDGTLELRMSRSSPGRYALHEFAKNVYDVRATDEAGRALEIMRPNPHQWDVTGHRGTVRVEYTIFGDRSDGTYLAVDNTHAHMNIPATFMWARGLEERPIRLRVVPLKDSWRVATQLAPTSDPYVYTAPNLYYFLDSPTEVSDHELYEWDVASNGETYTIRLALHHEGTEEQARAYTELAKAVVREQLAVYGELPDFDYGTYTFLADYLPWVNGDGMEHRNSTVLSTTRSLDRMVRNLGTLSHEFFHAWNVERLRPRSLEPFDFEHANLSGELWFAEGFTRYYDDLTLKRAGILSLDRYARELTANLQPIVNAPGRRFHSPVAMSQRAPFVDAAVSVDPTNRANIFASYYPYGAVVAMGLDLTLRSRFPGKSLDDYMRLAWTKYGKTEIAYTIDDLEGVLAELTGEAAFARDFFARYVHDSELPDFEELLSLAGLDLTRPKSDQVWLGGNIRDVDGKVRVSSRALAGGPLYLAGLDRGDTILELGGKAIDKKSTFDRELAEYEPAQTTTIRYQKRGDSRVRDITFQGDPAVELVPFEHSGREVTPEVAAFRKAWLESDLDHGLQKGCEVCGRTYPFHEDYCRYDGKPLRPKAP